MMRQKHGPNGSAEKHVKEIKRKTRRKFSAEEKIRIVLDGLRGECSISELCRWEGIAESLYYNWSKARIFWSNAHKRYWECLGQFFIAGMICIASSVKLVCRIAPHIRDVSGTAFQIMYAKHCW